MILSDYIVRATAKQAQIRAFAITSREIVETARQKHNTSPVVTAALGRLLSAGAMMGSMLKADTDILTLQVKGDGPMHGLTVTADAKARVKGYADVPDVLLPPNAKGKLDVGGAIGAGNIIVTRYLQNAEPFTGYAELVDGEIASDLTNYLYTSEQTPSSVALGVLVNKEGQVIASGGYFIQAMPGCAEETLAQLEENISLTPYVTQLLELGYTPEKMIETIARGLDVTIQESIELSYKCRCSREKILGALATLGQEDISAMSQDEETEVHCQFCNETYKFSGEEIARLLKK